MGGWNIEEFLSNAMHEMYGYLAMIGPLDNAIISPSFTR